MTEIGRIWGAGPTSRYEAIAAGFRPLFVRVRENAVKRDIEHILPREEVAWLRDAGFSTLRLPAETGGLNATLPELFALIVELGAADCNLPNIFRSHFGFVEDILTAPDSDWRRTWLAKVANHELVGSGFSELGEAPLGKHSTQLIRNDDHYLLNGAKYYTTGSLFSDWINLGASDEDGKLIRAVVPVKAPGVEIIDDWDGFGQPLSASGTARFRNVRISPDLIHPASGRFSYSAGFFQLVHLATLAGIGRAAADELAEHVSQRKRVYGRGNAPLAALDPQILQVVGRVRSNAYAAGAIVLKAAEALDRAYEAALGSDDAIKTVANFQAEIEINQSVTVVTSLILDATTILFDALGASATNRKLGLDRHWRNARTISSHNPRIYHDRIVGDFAVNGTSPVPHGGVGVAA